MTENPGDLQQVEDPDMPDDGDEGGVEPPGEEVDGPDEADHSIEDTAHADGDEPAAQ